MKYYSKEELINHSRIIDDDKLKLIKALETIDQGTKYYSFEFTNFLSPSIYEIVKDYMIPEDFQISFIGGHVRSERKILVIHPSYMEAKEEDLPITALQINYSKKYSDISHSDILGTLMASGIKREFVGDIYVYDNYTQVTVMDSIVDYLEMNINKVRHSSVSIDRIPLSKLAYKENDYKVIKTTINSNRVDAIIASGFALDRKSSKKKVLNEMVKVNHRLVDTPHIELVPGDLVSVQGEGRIILEALNGFSKKNRLKIIIKRVI
jgi:RNA-binding protein YlmH